MMQTKTYSKRLLWVLVFFFGLLSPYSFFQDNVHTDSTHQDSASEHIQVMQEFSHIANTEFSFHITNNIAHAEDSAASKANAELAATLEWFLKVIYVLLWPLLWIAWLAMDNSLVYGEIFGLDTALFKFWSIMKNFANFALGFLFVWSIVSYVINPNEKKDPKDMITKLLVAWVWVQLSWFIIGALVDISTVLTVWVWWLPLQLVGNADAEWIGNKPVFAVKTAVRLNDVIWSDNNLVVLYTRPGSSLPADKYLLPCYFKDQQIDFGTWWRTAFGVSESNSTITGTNNVQRSSIEANYCIAGNNIVSKEVYDTKADKRFISWEPNTSDIIKESLTKFRWTYCEDNTLCQTMSTFAKSAEWYQWAFYSLYSSLLGLATIHIGVPKSTWSVVMETLIKTIVWLAYLIPLAILCVVLVMRVGYLWLIIAFSPFIVLASVDNFWIKALEGGLKIGGMDEKFNLSSVISLLLLPVVVTFTMSLSIVFLSSLSEWLSNQWSSETLGIYQTTEDNYKCYDIAVTNICIDMPSQDIGTWVFDYFSWFIMNIFGIGLMWFMVMTALQSSKFTAKIAKDVQDLSQSMIQSAPIIPLGGDKSTSLGALKELPKNLEGKIRNAQTINSGMFSDMIEWKIQDTLWKDEKWNKVLASNANNIRNAEEAAEAIRQVAQDEAFTDSNRKMEFWDYDWAHHFATALTNWWDSSQWPKPIFNSGADLFKANTWGHQLLANILDATEGKENQVTMEMLKSLYSPNINPNNPQLHNIWKGIEANITSLRQKSYTDATSKTPYILKNNIIYKLKPETKTIQDAVQILDINPVSQHTKEEWETLCKELKVLWVAGIQGLGIENLITTKLLDHEITSTQWDKFKIIKNAQNEFILTPIIAPPAPPAQ